MSGVYVTNVVSADKDNDTKLHWYDPLKPSVNTNIQIYKYNSFDFGHS